MKEIEYGPMTFVTTADCYGREGIFIQLKGRKPGLFHMGSNETMWVSTKLAKDLGLIGSEEIRGGDIQNLEQLCHRRVLKIKIIVNKP